MRFIPNALRRNMSSRLSNVTNKMQDKKNLGLLLASHFPILVIETHEEARAVQLLEAVVRPTGKSLFTWSAASGLQNNLLGKAQNLKLVDAGPQPAEGEDNPPSPRETLEHIDRKIRNAVVVLLDFHPYLEDPRTLRQLKEIAQNLDLHGNSLVLISHQLEIPAEVERLCTHYRLSLPDTDRMQELVRAEARNWQMKNGNRKVGADRRAMELLVRNLVGMTESDARRLIRNAIYDDGAITHSDVESVMDAKYRLGGQDGILSYEYDTARFSDIGGFANMKTWLERRKNYFLANRDGNAPDLPKGILLLGVQGCGKSLAAKTIAGVWGVPLLRMDIGALYSKWIGETEKNIREALHSAESLAPCVLWIDEIEKGVQSGDADGGTSQRVLGTLLTWMAERKSAVFMVATANDVSALPPELMRKGRIDEIFFVDLPDSHTREAILAVHLRKREMDPASFDLAALARASDGFSGAELEQAVVAARFAAASEDGGLSTQHILEEMQQTRPLSVVRAEDIDHLRHWAADRTVPAN